MYSAIWYMTHIPALNKTTAVNLRN